MNREQAKAAAAAALVLGLSPVVYRWYPEEGGVSFGIEFRGVGEETLKGFFPNHQVIVRGGLPSIQ
jgi:hypothetical protein